MELVWQYFFQKRNPSLTATVRNYDHAMTWYDHGGSYSPWYIMAWSSWNIAWPWHGRHEKYYDHAMATMVIIVT